MGNKRLYEVAKELGKSANEVIEVLKKHNIEKGNFSGMDEKEIDIVKKAYAPKPAPKPSAPAPRQQGQQQRQPGQGGQRPQGQQQRQPVSYWTNHGYTLRFSLLCQSSLY